MVPPPAKKRRLSGPVVVASRRTTRSQKPRLSADLLGKVATYSSLGEDLLNLCIMAGPKDCAAIRHAYLRNNLHYLEASLGRYVEHDEDSDWESRLCRDRYRAWTEVNADWRRLVTEERIDSLARASEEDTENEADCMYAFVDPLIPLVNPAVAIELGLIETLKHLVEKRGIDVNAYRWTNYTHGRVGPVHLLMHCIGCDAFESFEYLLSRSDIDINCQYKDEAEEAATILEHCFGFECRFFRGLLRHPTCNFSTNFKFREQSVPLHFALFFLTAFFEKSGSMFEFGRRTFWSCSRLGLIPLLRRNVAATQFIMPGNYPFLFNGGLHCTRR